MDPGSLAAGIASALEDPALRNAAAAVALDIAAMPSPAETADELIELAGRWNRAPNGYKVGTTTWRQRSNPASSSSR